MSTQQISGRQRCLSGLPRELHELWLHGASQPCWLRRLQCLWNSGVWRRSKCHELSSTWLPVWHRIFQAPSPAAGIRPDGRPKGRFFFHRCYDIYLLDLYFVANIISLPKVIWEEGCVAALLHTYAVGPHWLQWRTPNSPPILPLPVDQSPNPHYLPHPWTRPTYDAKLHPDPIRCFSTMHWTDQRTDAPTDRQIVHGKVWLL